MERLEDYLPGENVSRETLQELSEYVELLLKWNKSINLISTSTVDEIWTRHILDSAQLIRLRVPGCAMWADFGSGGGLPGLVLAIIAKGQKMGIHFTLVESDQRKSVFLSEVARRLSLPVTILSGRTETLTPLGADVVSARAVSSLDTLCMWASRHLKPSGRAVFPKGMRSNSEIDTARINWDFELQQYHSITDPDAVILVLENIRHV